MLANDLEVSNVKEHVFYMVKYLTNNNYTLAKNYQEGGSHLVMLMKLNGTLCQTV